jgi:hypothetical protein
LPSRSRQRNCHGWSTCHLPSDFTAQRNALAQKMVATLDKAAFHGGAIDAGGVDAEVQQASALVAAVQAAATAK